MLAYKVTTSPHVTFYAATPTADALGPVADNADTGDAEQVVPRVNANRPNTGAVLHPKDDK